MFQDITSAEFIYGKYAQYSHCHAFKFAYRLIVGVFQCDKRDHGSIVCESSSG